MKKNRKSKTLKKDIKKIRLFIILFLVIIFINLLMNIIEKQDEVKLEKENNSSIAQILSKYGCVFIKEETKEDEYLKNIYLKFKHNPIEENNSKQRVYENIIGELANFIKRDFRLIDEEKNIKVEVKKTTNGYTYTINGKEDYFKKELSKLTLKNYKEEKNINIQINSPVLQDLINNKWSKNSVNFGTRDSEFDKYDIYFDEGIRVRNISKKIFNIVFTKKYTNEVINGIIPGTTFNEIISKLGNPIYGDENGEYIGYRNSQMYVFFTKDNISIYRNEIYEIEEFENLLQQYIDKEINIKEFMNELTYLWPDYEEYKYNSNLIYINYPIRGLRIEMNKDDSLGISIYKNYNITKNISKLINEEKITGKIIDNLMDITFQKEIFEENDKKNIAIQRENGLNENISKLYLLYFEMDLNDSIKSLQFISKDENIPNRQLNIQIDDGFFINDEMYIYSITNKGIYLFNIGTNEIITVQTGEKKYKLIEYKDNVLKFDNEEIKLIME